MDDELIRYILEKIAAGINMPCWETLGVDFIQLTEDDNPERTVKKAYVKRVRRHSPERDPEGFQRIREAYEQAMQWLDISQKIIAEIRASRKTRQTKRHNPKRRRGPKRRR